MWLLSKNLSKHFKWVQTECIIIFYVAKSLKTANKESRINLNGPTTGISNFALSKDVQKF